MSSAICFRFNKSEILSSCYGLKRAILMKRTPFHFTSISKFDLSIYNLQKWTEFVYQQ